MLRLFLQETVDAGATHTVVVAAGVGVKGHASPAKSSPELSCSNDDVSEFSPQDGGVTSGGRPSSFKHCLVVEAIGDGVGLDIGPLHLIQDFDSHDRLVVETTQLKHHTITHLIRRL